VGLKKTIREVGVKIKTFQNKTKNNFVITLNCFTLKKTFENLITAN